MSHSLRAPWWFVAATLAFVAALNRGLPGAWVSDPANRWGLPAFIAWIVGAGWCTWRLRPPARSLPAAVAGLVLAAAGEMSALAALVQAGLAFVVAALPGHRMARRATLLAAIGWTPAWGWCMQQLLGTPLDTLRLPFTAACIAAGFLASHEKTT